MNSFTIIHMSFPHSETPISPNGIPIRTPPYCFTAIKKRKRKIIKKLMKKSRYEYNYCNYCYKKNLWILRNFPLETLFLSSEPLVAVKLVPHGNLYWNPLRTLLNSPPAGTRIPTTGPPIEPPMDPPLTENLEWTPTGSPRSRKKLNYWDSGTPEKSTVGQIPRSGLRFLFLLHVSKTYLNHG